MWYNYYEIVVIIEHECRENFSRIRVKLIGVKLVAPFVTGTTFRYSFDANISSCLSHILLTLTVYTL